MLGATKLKRTVLKFPNASVHRYIWGDVSTFELVLSLKPGSYFTHYTAMHLHGFTLQIPKIIYLNFEQPPKRFQDRDLEQGRIDAAFRRPVRISKYIAPHKDQKICLLNGMFTGRLGVIEMQGPNRERISVTDPERTLIDITVRPTYAGGVHEVLNAFRLAQPVLSVNKLTSYLKKLNYIYPYHQAIGFYLEKAGNYQPSQIKLLKKFEIKYDFYLTHDMKEKSFSEKWHLYFPKGL
jgi:predicted transcriptional regulator of viral defense system